MQFLVIISMVKIGGNLIYHQVILAITFGKYTWNFITHLCPLIEIIWGMFLQNMQYFLCDSKIMDWVDYSL